MTFAALTSSSILEQYTVPYNNPDVDDDPLFFIDMTASVGMIPDRYYDKDVYDSTFWQSRQIDSVIMSWIPYFSNCEGYDHRMILYDVLEFDSACNLPEES